MRLHAGEHRLAHPWEAVSIATWLKYPSERAPHVEAVDYLARAVDARGRLVTRRLLVCRTAVPGILAAAVRALEPGAAPGPAGVPALFVERSEVDPAARRATLSTRNVTLSRFLSLHETCVYEAETAAAGADSSATSPAPDEARAHPRPGPPPAAHGTVMRQEARVTASLPGLWAALRDAVEVACVSRFRANAHRGRAALEEAAARAAPHLSLSDGAPQPSVSPLERSSAAS